jgi:hypothetical protein
MTRELNKIQEDKMSTRCQIGFYESKPEKLDQWEALIYRHSDGYPDSEHGVLATVLPILHDFDKNRGLDDAEYAAAWLVARLKTDYLNIGISKEFHGDIEFYYVVYPSQVDVYKVGYDSPPEQWNLIQTELI